MAKEYIIPHNYKNNGRIFNLFEKATITKILIWSVPVTAIIFNLPITIFTKFLITTLVVLPPAIIILSGFDDVIQDVINFSRKRRVYYDVKRDDTYEYWYQKEKRANPGK